MPGFLVSVGGKIDTLLGVPYEVGMKLIHQLARLKRGKRYTRKDFSFLIDGPVLSVKRDTEN